MNLKANPCKDFYQYSCGGWLDKTPIPDSKSQYSTFTELASKNKQTIKLEIAKVINGQVNVSVTYFLIFSFRLCDATSYPSISPTEFPIDAISQCREKWTSSILYLCFI